jgi:DNA-binding transcriptional regulator YiaG
MKCECGCGETTRVATKTDRAAGSVKGRPLRFIPGHNNRLRRAGHAVEDRGHITPCWIWQGSVNHAGYGRNSRGMAHRSYYAEANGPIPDGFTIDHLCRVRACVNPEHMEVVTHKENTRRGAEARAAVQGPHPLRDVRHELGMSQADAARALGVSQALVALWETGKSPMHSNAPDRLRTAA